MENTTKKKILFISSEMSPFLEETPLATISRMLPEALQQQENDIRILVPRFGTINERRNRLHEVVRLSGINITIDDNDHQLLIKVASIPETKMQVYFLDNEDYFQRKSLYGNAEESFFKDNDERTIFFCKGVMETVKKLGWIPDIIHCQGWMTSLIPLYHKTIYKNEPVFRNAKVVYSLFKADKANLGQDFARKAALNTLEDNEVQAYANADIANLQQGAVMHSDGIVNCNHDCNEQMTAAISDTPMINHTEDELGIQYGNFYNSLLGIEEEIPQEETQEQ